MGSRLDSNFLVNLDLKNVDRYISSNRFDLAKMNLEEARNDGASAELLHLYEEKLKVAETVYEERKQELVLLVETHLAEGDTESAKKCLAQLRQMAYLSQSQSIIDVLQHKIWAADRFNEINEYYVLAKYHLSQYKYAEARNSIGLAKVYLDSAKNYLSMTIFNKFQQQFESIDIICDAEYYIRRAEDATEKFTAAWAIKEANKHLGLVKQYNLYTQNISELRQRLDAVETKFKIPKDTTESSIAIGVQTSGNMTKFFSEFNTLKNNSKEEFLANPSGQTVANVAANMDQILNSGPLNAKNETAMSKGIGNDYHPNRNDTEFDNIINEHANTKPLNNITNPSNNTNYYYIHPEYNHVQNHGISVNIEDTKNGVKFPADATNQAAVSYASKAGQAKSCLVSTVVKEDNNLKSPELVQTVKTYKESESQISKCASEKVIDNVAKGEVQENAPLLENEPKKTSSLSLNRVIELRSQILRSGKPAIPTKPDNVASHTKNQSVAKDSEKPAVPKYPIKDQVSLENPTNKNHAPAEPPYKQQTPQQEVSNKQATPSSLSAHRANSFTKNPALDEKSDKQSVNDEYPTHENHVEAPTAPKMTDSNLCAEKCGILAKMTLDMGKIEKANKILDIAEKLYPSYNYAFLRMEIFAAQSKINHSSERKPNNKENNFDGDNLADGVKNINLGVIRPSVAVNNIDSDTTNNYIKNDNIVNTNPGTIDNNTKDIGQAPKSYSDKLKSSGYALKPKEKSTVARLDEDETNHQSEGKENANKDGVQQCLDKAKDALEAKDFEKAERLARRSDRMKPSEESKALLAKVIEAKRYGEKKSEYRETTREDQDQASKSFQIAIAAYGDGDYDKCERFLIKAKRLDKTINIDCYMSTLPEKKRRAKIEQEKAENQAKHNTNQDKSDKTGSKNGKSIFQHFGNFLFGTAQDEKQPKNQVVQSNAKHQNTTFQKEGIKTKERLETQKPSQQAKEDSKMDVDDDGDASFEKVEHTDVEMADIASGSTPGVAKNEDEEKSLKTKSEQLIAKALNCFDERDYIQAENLLTVAYGLNSCAKTLDIMRQVKDEIEKMTNPANKDLPANQEMEASEKVTTANQKEAAGTKTNEETKVNLEGSKSEAYYENRQHLAEKFQPSTHGSSYGTRCFVNQSNNHNHSYNLRARTNRSAPHDYVNVQDNDYCGRGRGRINSPNDLNNIYDYGRSYSGTGPGHHDRRHNDIRKSDNEFALGLQAYSRGDFDKAEDHFTASEQIHPNATARDYLTKVRRNKTYKSNEVFTQSQL